MATIRPFRALRPRADLASRICELPYDVMSSEEARELARENPLSFLRVSKPEIGLPPGTSVYSAEVYQRGRAEFTRLIQEGALVRDALPAFHLYRQVMGSHAQTGVVATASCEEYLTGVIKRHEFTRPDKEDDRVRHIEVLDAQTGPAFLTFRPQRELGVLIEARCAGAPEVDFVAADGVRHTAWGVRDAEGIQSIERAFASIPSLYIADGHHRSAAAARVYQARAGGGGSAWFLAVIFPSDQLRILPYHRLVRDLNGLSPEDFLKRLDGVCVIRDLEQATPGHRHGMGLYLGGRWRALSFRPHFAATIDPLEKLDVTLLQKYVLAPLLGIDDPRTSGRIQFVGGIRGTAELERLVQSGEGACAFSMFPTSIDDLMTISDGGGIMPPKSTWFEPKLRDAMFCHLLEPVQG